MKNNNIETYKDLMAEKARLEAVIAGHKSYILEDVRDLMEALDPFRNAMSVVRRFFTRGDKSANPLVTMGINVAGDIVLKRFLLARAGWLARLVIPYLVKNYSSHLLNKGLVNLNKITSSNGSSSADHGSNFLQRFGDKLKSSATQKNITVRSNNTTTRVLVQQQ